jgi:transposase-like protein
MARKQRSDRDENGAPNTLLEAVKYFADPDVAHRFVATLRWPNGDVSCPRCDGTRHSYLETRRVWKCLGCKKQFSVKVGTIFEDSPLSLSKWMPAMWQLANCKNGISSYELARALGVTQKTAWFMLARIRLAMQQKSFRKIGGHVEVDETYIGGKSRNMHASKRERMGIKAGRSMAGKAVVMGLLERHGKDGHSTVRTHVVTSIRKAALQGVVREHVEAGSAISTDALRSYTGLSTEYIHGVIDHAEAYVDGAVHTNGCENFWSLLKRAIKGTYVAVEPFHLFRYLDEQSFRFNNRSLDDAGRFLLAAASIFGKRVMYRELTGHVVAAV